MSILLTTTGSDFTIGDLGGRVIAHPTVDLDLVAAGEYTESELKNSRDLQTGITGGDIIAEDDHGNVITDLLEWGYHGHVEEDIPAISSDYQARSEKDQHGGYVGQDASGNAAVDGTVTGGGFSTAGNIVVGGTVDGRDVASDGTAQDNHIASTSNPHAVSKAQIGLSNVTNDAQIPLTQKGAANGVATLDAGGKVPASQLALSGLEYQGTWNANTNTPTLTSSTGTQGYYYVVSVAGSTNLDGETDWDVGDWAVFNGSTWEKADHSDSVTSVAGKTGAVTLDHDDITDFESSVSANTDVSANTAHRSSTANPHVVTKTQVGLGSVTDDAQLKRADNDWAGYTVDTTPAAADKVLVEEGTGGAKKTVALQYIGGRGGLSKLFQATDGVGGLTVTSSYQSIPLTREGFKDDYYSHAANSDEVTIIEAGLYTLNARTCIKSVNTSGSTRGRPKLQVQEYIGGTWTALADASEGYVREDSVGLATTLVVGPILYTAVAGVKLRLVVKDARTGGIPNEETVADASSLSIRFEDRSGSLGDTVNNLKDVGDVNANAPSDRDILRFDSASSKWEAESDEIVSWGAMQLSADYAAVVSDPSVWIIDTSGSTPGTGYTLTLFPSSDQPNDGRLYGRYVHKFAGDPDQPLTILPPPGETFADGLTKCVMRHAGETVRLGGMYMNPGNGWLRLLRRCVVCQVRRDTTWSALNFSSPAPVPWTINDVEDNDAVLDFTSGPPELVTAHYSARYMMSYQVSIDSTGGSTWNLTAYLRINGTTIIPGSVRTGNYGGEDASLSLPRVDYDLVAGDYIELVLDHTNLTGEMWSAIMNISAGV